MYRKHGDIFGLHIWCPNRVAEEGVFGNKPALQSLAVILLLIVIILSTFTESTQTVSADIWDPYYPKTEKITQWKALFDNPGSSYEKIGYSFNSQPIYAFYCGNPQGGRVLWTSEIHGSEDNGERIVYSIATWLLTSGESDAKSILSHNYICFVPIVNVDSIERGNADTTIGVYGVDLNRNFVTGWRTSTPRNDNYSGASPASEPETKAVRALLTAFKPEHYTDVHVGAGPYAAYYSESNATLISEIEAKIQQIKGGVSPYRMMSMGSEGFAMGDASALGAKTAWLVESIGESEAWTHTSALLTKIDTYYMPKLRLLFIAQCSASSSAVLPVPDNPGSFFGLGIPVTIALGLLLISMIFVLIYFRHTILRSEQLPCTIM